MLIVSLLVFLSAPLFPERPAGMPVFADLVPGLMLTDPLWLARVTGHQFGLLEGAFWSLFVEVKFYIFVGSVFYIAGRASARLALVAAFGVALLAAGLSAVAPSFLTAFMVRISNDYFGFHYYGWFLVGALLYDLKASPSAAKLAAVWGVGLLNCLFYSLREHDPVLFGMAFFAFALFVGSLYCGQVQRFLMQRWLLLLGFASYPLYLLHENIMVALIKKIGKGLGLLPDGLVPIFPIFVVIALSYFIARYIEPRCREAIAVILASVSRRALPQ